MKYSKSIFKILIVFLLIAQNSFANTTPIPGVGIVVKKNPGGANITVPTGNGGGFSTQLSEGVYELSFPQDQLQTSINSIVKSNFPKSNYQYDGSGVEMVLDNSQITVNSKASEGNVFAIDKQNSSITITVPKGGATLSGKLGWNDAVMTNSISCPDGFIMQNGECVPVNNAGNQQARTESTPIKGISVKAGHNPKPTMMVSLNANGGTSSSTGIDNSLSFNPSLGIAIHWKNFGIGLDAGTFSTKPDFDFDAYAAPLQNLDFLTITNTKSEWTSTYFMLGPQYTIPLSPSQSNESGRHTPFHNKLTFTVALKGGLTINKAPEFSVMDKSTPPKSIASYNAPQDYKTNAFSLKPSIGFDYWINENFALTANAQYLMQTGQKEFTTGYRDLTNVNLAPPISPDQFQKNIAAAPKVMTNTKGPENYMSFGIGITYRRCPDGSCRKNKTASNGTQRKGITEKGLPKNEMETASNETQRKGINEKGLPKNEMETASDGPQKIAIKEQGVKKSDIETTSDGTQRKGIQEGGLKKNEVETASDGTQKIAIKEQGVKKSDVETASNETQRKGINEKGLPKNEMETASNDAQRKGITQSGIKKNDVETASNEAQRKGIKEQGLPKNEVETVSNEAQRKGITEKGLPKNEMETASNETQRKGWDGSIKGKNIAEKGIQENGLKKNELETASDETQRKGIKEQGLPKNEMETASDGPQKIAIKEQGVKKSDIETASEETQRKGIRENGLKKNETEYVLTDAEVKAIAEILVNFRKGWDGSIKGNIAEKKGIKENGLKQNEAKSENINLVTSTAQTLVNLARKGWDGSVKGNKIENLTNEADVKSIAETLVNIRKGWDGSIKGNKVENAANEADIKMIAEAFVNLRKGWDGSIKGNIMENAGPEENGDNIESIHIKITIITKVGFTDCGSPGSFFCIRVEVGALANDHNLGDLSLEKDQIITNSNVALVNDNIIKVTSVGVKSTISEKTMSEFANKTQKNKEFTLDKNVLDEICKALHLNTPIEPVIFRAVDQKYEVINTVNEGKEVQILEIHQKTKIKIDGKEYTLSMLTRSGKGLNSPKN